MKSESTLPKRLTDKEIIDSKEGRIDWKALICSEGDDLISSPSTAPGRPRTFLLQPELNTAPFSCELIVYNNDLYKGFLQPASRFLRCGAGVKLILDDYQQQQPAEKGFRWGFKLSSSHPDYCNLSTEQKQYLVDDGKRSRSEGYYFDRYVVVEDSMEAIKADDPVPSIQESWQDMILVASKGESICFDLSYLRPHGTVNSKGLMASGPIGLGKHEVDDESCSFFSIYQRLAEYLIDPTIEKFLILTGTLNDTLRRGGFKRGIITSGMDWRNPHFKEYLDAPLVNLPGGHKKGARLSKEILEGHDDLLKSIVEKRNSESLFLAKIKPNFFDNVCMGLGIVNFGTCLIWRFNIGMVQNMCDIPAWMDRVVTQLTLLHLNWRSHLPEVAKIVAPPEQDLQIGFDIMGMANALSHWDINYGEFLEALLNFNDDPESFWGLTRRDLRDVPDPEELVYWLAKGYRSSTEECDRICDLYQTPRMKRIHTASEPAQSHSYETKDVNGYTTCRAIFPPAGKRTRRGVRVRRVSNHQKNKMVNHGLVETASEVGPQLHELVCAEFSRFVKLVGRSHDYMSFDDWQPMTEERLIDWLENSQLDSMYYNESRNFDQNYLTKAAPSLCSLENKGQEPHGGHCDLKSQFRGGECAVCAE